ncbi:hypothetical protein KY328_00055, partial [Candidatus Woesearchaeota archaeon]|nr:hypothetical protein [Candidatus Woesearchaeota archaeon]
PKIMKQFIESERWYSIDTGVQQVYRLLEDSKPEFLRLAKEKGKEFWLRSIIYNRQEEDTDIVRAAEQTCEILKASELVLTLNGKSYKLEFPGADIRLIPPEGDMSAINDFVDYETLSLLVCEGKPTTELVSYINIITKLIAEKQQIKRLPFMLYRHLRRKKLDIS